MVLTGWKVSECRAWAGGMNFNGKMNPGDFSHDMGGDMPQGGPQGERQSDGQGGGKNWRQ